MKKIKNAVTDFFLVYVAVMAALTCKNLFTDLVYFFRNRHSQ